MRLISAILAFLGTASAIMCSTDITTVLVPIDNLRLEPLSGSYRFTGRVQYDLAAADEDSLVVQLSFAPATAGSSAPSIIPESVSGDIGTIAWYSGRRTIYFACTVDRIPSEAYRAQITLTAERSSVEKRIDTLLAKMQQQEKVDQLHGNGGFETIDNTRLSIPGFTMADGPHGVRSGQATLFPTLAAQACSWDTSLSYRIGVALAKEFRAKGKYVALGPMINTVRDPRGGRDFETYSEDPYLMSRMAVADVKGIQSLRVIAVPKHLICNDMENNRMYYDVQVGQRTLREIYAPAFKACAQEAGAWGIMAAYNKANGFFCTENSSLLKDLLKTEWGFRGFVVSDWGATHSTANAANGGLDVEMPGGVYFSTALSAALVQGKVTAATIDDKVRRVLRAKIWAGVLDQPIQQYTADLNSDEHKALSLEAGRASMVLAKNEGAILPLNAQALSSVAVIGPYADAARLGGGGSSA